MGSSRWTRYVIIQERQHFDKYRQHLPLSEKGDLWQDKSKGDLA